MNVNWQNELAGRLAELRKREGLSQEEVAERVGVSRQAVSKWEGAQGVPDVEKLLLLAECFGVSMDWLLRGVEPSAGVAPEKDAEPVAAAQTAAGRRPSAAMWTTYIATALIWCGLLAGWAISDYYQVSAGGLLSVAALVLALLGLAFGLRVADEDERRELKLRFWRVNVWPLVLMAESAVLSALRGWWIAPVLTSRLLFSHGAAWFWFVVILQVVLVAGCACVSRRCHCGLKNIRK